nr:unnamed protein product [Spirometra erinaceieuropaei]
MFVKLRRQCYVGKKEGLLGEKDLAVQTILNNVESVVFFLFPLGFALATTIRIGQYLGANDSATPRSTACVGFVVVFASGVAVVVLLTSLRSEIPKIFSNDPGVIEMASQYFPSIITFQFFDSINGINAGIVRGVGKQKIGAVVCCVCMYLIGGPAGLSLMFLTPLGVSGFWWGLSIGAFVQSVVYTVICARIDWTKECEKAAKRTAIKFIGDSKEFEMKAVDKQSEYGCPEGGCGYEYGEDTTSSEEEKPVKRCPPRVLLTRSVFVSIMLLMLVVSICCRLFLDWSDYFPSYCLLSRDFAVFTDHKMLTFVLRSHSDKYNPMEFARLDYTSQFTTDIRQFGGTKNEVANMLSRPSLSSLQLSHGIDLCAMAAEQQRVGCSEDESFSGLQLKHVSLITGTGAILCDVSTPFHRPFLPASTRRAVFQTLHELFHRGI